MVMVVEVGEVVEEEEEERDMCVTTAIDHSVWPRIYNFIWHKSINKKCL